jgi:hypothetical protein
MTLQSKVATFFAYVVLLYGLYQFASSLASAPIATASLALNVDQLAHLILITISVIVLNSAFEVPVIESEIAGALNPHVADSTRISSVALWKSTRFLLLFIGIIVPLLNLFGAIPAKYATTSLALKVGLVLLTTTYLMHVWSLPDRVRETIRDHVMQQGAITVLDRDQDHAFMSRILDEIEIGATLLVTNFEEPATNLKDAGYYYEKEFMLKWYSTIREKKLIIKQILLINSDSDLHGLNRRLELIQDIPSFYISCLLAPPLTVFVDFMVVPQRYALIGFSDDRRMRNMDQFSFLVSGGAGVGHFEHLFTDVLSSEAIHIKTFEGVQRAALQTLYDQAHLIARSSSTVLRDYFQFTEAVKPYERRFTP